MMIRISDPELMPALVAHLRQSEFAVQVLDAQTLEAHLPGVDPAQAERELRLYLDVWRVLHPDSQIELERKTRRWPDWADTSANACVASSPSACVSGVRPRRLSGGNS
jgi:hypothetical protein